MLVFFSDHYVLYTGVVLRSLSCPKPTKDPGDLMSVISKDDRQQIETTLNMHMRIASLFFSDY